MMKDSNFRWILFILSLQVLSIQANQCDSGWIPFSAGCFQLSNHSTSWTRAFQNCRQKGAVLLGLSHFRLLDPIFQREKLHLDANDSLAQNNSCKAIERSGKIEGIDCFKDSLQSICIKESTSDIFSLDKITEKSSCPEGFVGFQNNCYFLSKDSKNNADAKAACENLATMGATLAIIRNGHEDQFAKELVQKLRVYIGLEHLDGNGTYGWPDGSILKSSDYRNWKEGEPSSPVSNVEPCTEYWEGQWNDCGCGYARQYLCQVEKYQKPHANCDFEDGVPWMNDDVSGMCYAVLNKRKSWENAVATCAQLGNSSNLASLGSPRLESYIRKIFRKSGRQGTYWIGMRKLGVELFWSDKRPVSYMNWKELPEEGCATISLEDKESQWKFVSCGQVSLPAICERQAKNYREIPLPAANDCPVGWKRDGRNCYYFLVSGPKTFKEAERYCKGLHTHSTLALIKNKEDNDFIEASRYGSRMIGLRDINKDGSYIWSDGSKLEDNSFTFWAPDEPNHRDHTYNCVELFLPIFYPDVTGWKAISCDNRTNFVCSMEYTVCPGHSFVYNKKCFHTSNSPMTCDQAESYCKESLPKGHLASIHSESDNLRLRQALIAYEDSQWIGLKKSKGELHYKKWIDGSKIDYDNFMTGEGITEVDVCESMDYDGFWYPKPADHQSQVACSAKTNHYMKCQRGWVKSETSCYLLGREKVTYEEAKKKCKLNKAYLVQMESIPEIDFIEATYPFEIPGEYDAAYINFWIGLQSTEKASKYYVWGDGSELRIDNWLWPFFNGSECVWAIEGRFWATASCEEKALYLCESPMEISLFPSFPHSGCKESQTAFESFCYEFIYRLSSQSEAVTFCYGQNSKLLTVVTKEIQNRIISYISGIKEDVHMDLKYNFDSSSWMWGDGTMLEYSNWATGEPREDIQDDEGICAVIVTQGEHFGRWKSVGCSEKTNFICESLRQGYTTPGPTTTTTTTLSPEYKCPEKFFSYRDRCYYHSRGDTESEKSFDDAEAHCESFGARLAVFESLKAQEDFMEENYIYGIYIGLRYIPSLKKFVSVDPNIPFGAYENWYPDQPDLSMHCVYAIAQWSTVECNFKREYLCAMPPSKDPFTTTAPVTSIPEVPCHRELDGWFVMTQVDSTTCYKISPKNSLKSWFEARKACVALGGDLVSIHSQNANDFIWSKIHELGYKSNVWIGLNNLYPDSVHRWSDGSVYGYSNWGPGEPNDYLNMEGCAEIYTVRSGVWNDMHCQLERNYVCSKPRYGSYTTPKPTPLPKGHCELGVPEFEGHCYTLMLEEKLNWENANIKCTGLGSKAVSVHSEREMAFLISRVLPLVEEPIWTGGNDQFKEGTYHWSDQTSFDYTNWVKGQPQDSGLYGYDCLAIETKNYLELGQWFIDEHSSNYNFICKSLVNPSVNEFTYTLPACESNPKFRQYLDGCYLYVDQDKSWREASDHCKSMDSNLISIHDTRMNSFVLSQSAAHVWMGLSNTEEGNPNMLTWTDGSTYNYHKFEANATMSSQNCVYMDSTSSLWKIDSCSTRRHFLCEIKSETAPSGGSCPPEPLWKPGPLEHCFSFPPYETIDYNGAIAKCEDYGGQLAGIHNQRDNDWIKRKIKHTHQPSQYHWIGAYKFMEDDGSLHLNWVDSETFVGGYTNWESSNLPNSTSYGAFNSTTGKWVLLPTAEKLDNYICSVRKVIPTHPPVIPSTTSPNTPSTPSPKTNEGLGGGAIAGIVIGILVAFTLLGATVFLGLRSGFPLSPSFLQRASNLHSFSNFIYRTEARSQVDSKTTDIEVTSPHLTQIDLSTTDIEVPSSHLTQVDLSTTDTEVPSSQLTQVDLSTTDTEVPSPHLTQVDSTTTDTEVPSPHLTQDDSTTTEMEVLSPNLVEIEKTTEE